MLAVLADQVAADFLADAEATRSWLSELYFVQGRQEEQAQMLVANVGSEERRTAALLLEASQNVALDAATFEVRHLGRMRRSRAPLVRTGSRGQPSPGHP